MAWWQRGRSELQAARLAGPTDRPALADLLARAMRHHGVQAIEEQVALLNSGASSLTFGGGRATGFLGVHLRSMADGERWADVSLLAFGSAWDPEKALDALILSSLPALRQQHVTGLVCLTSQPWLYRALVDAGFVEADQVITYVRNGRAAPPPFSSQAELRTASPIDAETVLRINAAAFAPIWRYDDATTLGWLLTAEHSVLAEREGRPVGYALTARAGSDGYAQLIRVAVTPEWQGYGVGRSLVSDSICYGRETGALGVALNTQVSNATSRHLYEALGFRSAGSAINVMTYHVE